MKFRKITVTIKESIEDEETGRHVELIMPYRVECIMYDDDVLAFTDLKDEMIKMRACEMLEKLKEDIKQGVVNL